MKHITTGMWKNKKTGLWYMVTGTRLEATNNCHSAGKIKVDYEDDHDKYTRLKSEFLNKFTLVCPAGGRDERKDNEARD